MICVGFSLFEFTVFGSLCTSYRWIFVSFFRFGKFSAIISSNTLSIPFSPSSPSGIPIVCRLAHFILSHRSCILLSFLKFVFLSAILIVGFPLFYLPDHLFVLLHYSVCFIAFSSSFILANEFSNFT